MSKIKSQSITRILGIDPGYGRIGWGVVEKQKNNWVHVAHGCIETTKTKKLPARLKEISVELRKIFEEFQPQVLSIEELFFAKNVTTGLQVAQARGIMLLIAMEANIAIFECKPNQVKQAVTGQGNADKQQMQRMVQMLLSLKKRPTPDDAADALAIALTCGAYLR